MDDARIATDRIVLIGMMGSGKSTVGARLAERCGWRYVDNDDDVRTLTAQEPTEVISAGGEAELHAAEAAAFLRALGRPEPCVIAAAAWVVEDPACAAAIREERRVIYLRATPETLRARIGVGKGRRQDATDPAWLAARAAERDTTYRELATLVVEVDERGPDAIVDDILGQLS
jgi:shikimate kinase